MYFPEFKQVTEESQTNSQVVKEMCYVLAWWINDKGIFLVSDTGILEKRKSEFSQRDIRCTNTNFHK